MKIPKKPNYSKRPFPTDKERRDWDDFVNLTIAVSALVIALLNLFTSLWERRAIRMDNYLERIAIAIESAAKSLSTLVEDTKANKDLKIEVLENLEGMEKTIRELQDNPFGLNKGN